MVGKAQHHTQLTTAERVACLQKFYAYLYTQPSSIRFISMKALLLLLEFWGVVHTLEHMGTAKVMGSFDDGHFR